MHKKYAKDGVVCMSVTVDEVSDKEKALKQLQELKATFANYLIDETGDVWGLKLAIAPPTVFVYGRNGQLVKKFTTDEPFTYADVEKLVQAELQK